MDEQQPHRTRSGDQRLRDVKAQCTAVRDADLRGAHVAHAEHQPLRPTAGRAMHDPDIDIEDQVMLRAGMFQP